MECIWKIEEKWKITTQKALIFLVCSGLVVIGVCIATLLKRKHRKQIMNIEEESAAGGGAARGGCLRSKWRILIDWVKWRSANKNKLDTKPLVGYESRSSLSPLWQRPILMGEKCELPRFSGLILYDDIGRLLHNQSFSSSLNHNIHQEKPATVTRTMLKDLL